MARVYVAGPLFSAQDRQVLETLARQITELGHTSVLPHDEVPMDPVRNKEDLVKRQTTLRELLEGCDALVALLDGVDVDGGTCFEIGYAQALGRPILGLRSDVRTGGEFAGVNLMVAGGVLALAAVADWTPKSIRVPIEDFLKGVKVVAGRLVRDGVPRIAKESGKAIQFQPVDPSAYPKVVKRKIAEVARRMEGSDWGVEQEQIADLLELLEALIRSRNYDKESLRSIKEGTWRKRGGYEKGYVVDEEPKLS